MKTQCKFKHNQLRLEVLLSWTCIMLYKLLKIIIGFGLKLYYREIKATNDDRLQTKGAKIIIANHPNTIIDAWVITFLCNEPIYYMAKGVLFSSPFRRKLLGSLGMIPINRASDSNTSGVSNEDSFEMCYRLLEEGKTLVIFPEGTSTQERLLRMLKSGTARIALQTELRNNGNLGLKIIPVGLVYTQAEKFRSSILANVGEPISPLPYLDLYKTDTKKSAQELTNVFKDGLVSLLVDSKSKEHDEFTDKIVDVLSIRSLKTEQKGVQKDVALMKDIYQRLNEIRSSDLDKMEEIEELTNQISWQFEKLDVKSDFLNRKYRSMMFIRQSIQSGIGLLIGFPIFIFGLIHNIIPFKATDKLILKFVKDIEYYAPLAVLLGLILYPITYFSFLYFFGDLFELTFWMKVIYFFSMPLSGMFAYYYVQYFKHISFKWRFIFLMKTRKDVIHSLQNDSERLRMLIFE